MVLNITQVVCTDCVHEMPVFSKTEMPTSVKCIFLMSEWRLHLYIFMLFRLLIKCIMFQLLDLTSFDTLSPLMSKCLMVHTHFSMLYQTAVLSKVSRSNELPASYSSPSLVVLCLCPPAPHPLINLVFTQVQPQLNHLGLYSLSILVLRVAPTPVS